MVVGISAIPMMRRDGGRSSGMMITSSIRCNSSATTGRPSGVEYGVIPLATYGYDSAGRLQTVTRSGGPVTTTSYDGLGRVSDLHTTDALSATLTRFQYTYDRAGQRTAVVETVHGVTRTLLYGYDGVGRLVAEAVVGGDTTGYSYDRAGNRLSVVVNSVTVQSRTYNAANQVTTSGWTYDERGNLLTDSTHTYGYDDFDRLTGMTTGGITTTYRYHGEVLQRIVATGQPTQTLIQDTSGGLSQVVHANGRTFISGAFGERLAEEHDSLGLTYPLVDALGTVRMTDRANIGQTATTTQYDAWGTVQSGATPDPFGFTGELTDQTSGLVYLRARWYNPAEGTLLGRDPFAGYPESPYSLHPYQYGYSNPVSNTDPTGRCATGALVDTLACVGGAAACLASVVCAVAGVVAVVGGTAIAVDAVTDGGCSLLTMSCRVAAPPMPPPPLDPSRVKDAAAAAAAALLCLDVISRAIPRAIPRVDVKPRDNNHCCYFRFVAFSLIRPFTNTSSSSMIMVLKP